MSFLSGLLPRIYTRGVIAHKTTILLNRSSLVNSCSVLKVRQAFISGIANSSKGGSGAGGLGAAKNSSLAQQAVTQAKTMTQQIDEIIKSPEDKREYRALELKNGLKVFLISDPATDKAAASLDVNVGHLKDPRELPGLAHFCEHMLFLGTQKYPCENEYHKYLASHGGGSNAYTGSDHTNYFFDVAPQHLEGALDRFAQFFLKPLFTESATDREVNAVDSENSNNLQNDMWRLVQLERTLSNPLHDYSKYGTGNKQTLMIDAKEKGLNTRDELLKFHAQHYSANIMGLCIIGRESLDELSDMILKRFEEVENKSVPRYSWEEHPYGPEQLGWRIDVVPVKELRTLHMGFPIPDLHPHYRSQPGHYISHLLGHEGEGSLLSELKRRGWVSSLAAGPREGARGFGFFSVDVDLSEEGLKHIEEIVQLVFSYIGIIRVAKPQKWIHDECEQLNQIRFRFKDKEKAQNSVTKLSTRLHYYPEKEVLFGPYIMDDFRPDLIEDVLNRLRPDNMLYTVISKEAEAIADLQKEKWYGTEYKRTKLAENFLEKCHAASVQGHPDMCLPRKNEFIPTDFTIKCPPELRVKVDPSEDSTIGPNLIPKNRKPDVGPKIIQDDEYTRIWHKLDDEFLLPKNCAFIHLWSPLTYTDPLQQNLAYMYSVVLADSLTEYTYDAMLAGLSYSFSNGKHGMYLQISGYNEKQGHLLKRLVERMVDLKPDPQRFSILKEGYVRGLKSFKQEQPYQHAIYYSNSLLSERHWSKEQLLKETEELTVEALEAFIPHFLKSLHVEALFHGNSTEQEAKDSISDIWKIIRGTSNTKPLYSSQLVRDREVQIEKGGNYVMKQMNEVHGNSAVEIVYQTGVRDTRSNVLLELIGQIFSEPAFDTLRTKEQLGYIVFSGPRRSSGTQGLRFIVQGDRDPLFVEGRVEMFLRQMRADMEKMEDKEFQEHKSALAVKRLERPEQLSSLASSYWGEIVGQEYHFDRDRIEVETLANVSKKDVLEYFDSCISHEAEDRRKLTVQVFSQTALDCHDTLLSGKDETYQQTVEELTNCTGETARQKMPQAEKVRDPTEFKKTHALFPLPKPFISLPSAGLPGDNSKL